MYVMGKCPWCAKALEEIESKVRCDFTCTYQGETHKVRMV
jgi:hypothetical protein